MISASPYPLSRGYARETAVLAEIDRLLRLPAETFWSTVEKTDFRDAEAPRLETLVYLVRANLRDARESDAWRIVSVLNKRIAGSILRRVSKFFGLSRDQVDDLFDEIITELYEEWTSGEPAHEFWEIRFGICLDRTVIDALKRRRRIHDCEVALTAAGEDGSTIDAIEMVPDLDAVSPETIAEIRAALASLKEPLRTTFLLAEYAQWTEDSIAAKLGVTSRTIRNYLQRARQQLEPWRDEIK